MRRSYVTITARGTSDRLYLGVTTNLTGNLARHGGSRLVWYEEYPGRPQAVRRRADIKRWARGCKLALIEKLNPAWTDLSVR